jgi:hypothetical protein
VVHGTVDGGGGATTVAAEYGTDASFAQHTDGPTLDRAIGAQAVTITLTGLQPGTLHHVRLRATNAAGSVPSAETTFTTSAAPLTPGPGGSTPGPAAQDRVTLLTRRAKVSRTRRVRLVFANASGTTVTIGAGVRRLTRVASFRFAGARGSLTLKLSKAAMKRLLHTKHHRLNGVVQVTVTAPAGKRTFTQTVTFSTQR